VALSRGFSRARQASMGVMGLTQWEDRRAIRCASIRLQTLPVSPVSRRLAINL
jgi:hypothetical protein